MTEQEHPLTSKQAAKYIGVSEAALRLWRASVAGPRYYKAGEKLVRYRKSDLDVWIEDRLIPSAAEGRQHAG